MYKERDGVGKISKDYLSKVKLNGFRNEKRDIWRNVRRENVKTRSCENVFSEGDREQREELKK